MTRYPLFRIMLGPGSRSRRMNYARDPCPRCARPGDPRGRRSREGRAMTERVETVIIGGGQAGLAMSYCLSESGREHVVLERGRLAERWRSERWDSLTLLTPNWMTQLPGYGYGGDDPDGFISRDEVIQYL